MKRATYNVCTHILDAIASVIRSANEFLISQCIAKTAKEYCEQKKRCFRHLKSNQHLLFCIADFPIVFFSDNFDLLHSWRKELQVTPPIS